MSSSIARPRAAHLASALTLALLAAGPAAAQEEASPAAPASDPPLLRVMSFNIRYATDKDHLNAWTFRKDLVPAVVRQARPDVVGLQEVLWEQIAAFRSRLPGFGLVEMGRDGAAGGERCAILFREERLELGRSGTFWLSPTPDRPSAAWGARLRRIVTWAELTDRGSGTRFVVLDTHWDHQSANARSRSARLLLRKAQEIAGDVPVIVLGDLNCTEDSEPYRILVAGGDGEDADPGLALRDAFYEAEHGHTGPPGTFTGFGGGNEDGWRIDYVFVRGDVHVSDHAIRNPTALGGRTPSDHRPVIADLLVGVPQRREHVDLHAGWRFATDPKKVGERAGWHEPRFDDGEWERHVAGEPWERQGHPEYDGVAWYRRRVHVPESWAGRALRGDRIHLEAFGLDDTATVYVNGEEVAQVGKAGESFWKSRVAVHLPLGVFRFGEENLLALRVVDTRVFGGLTGRPLRLSIADMPTTHVSRRFTVKPLVAPQGFHVVSADRRRLTFPLSVPEETSGPVWLRWTVGDGYDDRGDRGLTVRLLDAEGTEVWSHFQRAKHDEHWSRVVPAGSKWTLVIEDLDTPLGGSHPGNGGRVGADVVFEAGR